MCRRRIRLRGLVEEVTLSTSRREVEGILDLHQYTTGSFVFKSWHLIL